MKKVSLIPIILLIILVGCRPTWQTTIQQPDGAFFTVDRRALKQWETFGQEVDGAQVVPLERALLSAGHTLVQQITVTDQDSQSHTYDWPQVAVNAWWLDSGEVQIGEERFMAQQIEIEPPILQDPVQAKIIDIAPTIATALGLPLPEKATGKVLETPKADHVLLIFLDAFGYVRYTEAKQDGLIPYLGSLNTPRVALTTYPPVTSVSTASLLTGTSPDRHGADQRGIRKTETETLFDVATAAGRQVVAVEGSALAFNLRNTELHLSGDQDNNGSGDDNVLTNALEALESGMPDLLFVHWHGIDDLGHTYGPGAEQEQAKIAEVDAQVETLINAVPEDTLVIIFADHGMHAVDEDGRLGNHGHLIVRDMLIPIFVFVK